MGVAHGYERKHRGPGVRGQFQGKALGLGPSTERHGEGIQRKARRPHINLDPALVLERGGDRPPGTSSTKVCFFVSPRSTTKRAKHRAPLPHCSASEPSVLKMR